MPLLDDGNIDGGECGGQAPWCDSCRELAGRACRSSLPVYGSLWRLPRLRWRYQKIKIQLQKFDTMPLSGDNTGIHFLFCISLIYILTDYIPGARTCFVTYTLACTGESLCHRYFGTRSIVEIVQYITLNINSNISTTLSPCTLPSLTLYRLIRVFKRGRERK